ncbi:MAG: M12 family metallo-peptidase, partial [Betaproteobacteria bacterium]
MLTHSNSRHFIFAVCTSIMICVAAPARAAAPLMAPINGAKNVSSKFDIRSKPAVVAINRAALAALRTNDEVQFTMPDGTQYSVLFDRIEDHGGGIRSTVGYLKQYGKDFRVIITTGPDGTFGSILTPAANYRIVPGTDGQDLLVNMTEENKLVPFINLGDDSRRVPDEPASGKPAGLSSINARAGDTETSISLVTPTPQATVDLMVVYSTGFAARLGSGLMTRLYNLVTAANTAYADSEVAITLRLVNATMVNYIDTDDDGDALDAITPVSGGGTGVFANIESIRNANGADMVSFMRTGSDFGGHGVAWLTTSATPQAVRMYSVVTGCVVGCD